MTPPTYTKEQLIKIVTEFLLENNANLGIGRKLTDSDYAIKGAVILALEAHEEKTKTAPDGE